MKQTKKETRINKNKNELRKESIALLFFKFQDYLFSGNVRNLSQFL